MTPSLRLSRHVLGIIATFIATAVPEGPGLCLFARLSSRLESFYCGEVTETARAGPVLLRAAALRPHRRAAASSRGGGGGGLARHPIPLSSTSSAAPTGRAGRREDDAITHNRDAPRPRHRYRGVLRSVSSRVGSCAEVGDPHHARVADVELRAAERVRSAERALGDEPAARPPGVTLVVNRRIGRRTLRRRRFSTTRDSMPSSTRNSGGPSVSSVCERRKKSRRFPPVK